MTEGRRKIRRAPIRVWSVDVELELADKVRHSWEGITVKAATCPRALNRALVAAMRDLKRREVRGRSLVRRARATGRPIVEG